ncbi:MAG: hypothetical protein M1133_04810 [Armatimonadetes bacterium]|nr:hypothetical protein [Armatimonadota bacterium]
MRIIHWMAVLSVLMLSLPALGGQVLVEEGFEAAKPTCEIHGLEIASGDQAGHSGTGCLRGFEPKAQTGPHDVRFTLDLNSDSLYRAELWLRSDNKCAASIGLVSVGSPDSVEGAISRFYNIPDKWTKYSVVFRIPSPDEHVLRVIAPHTWAGPTGMVWVDDVRVTEIATCKSSSLTPASDWAEDCSLAKTGSESAQLLYLAYVAGKERKLSGEQLALQQANDYGLMGFDHEEGYDHLVTMAYASGKWSTGAELARGMIFHPTIAAAKDGRLCAVWAEKGARGWVITYRFRTKSGWSAARSASASGGKAWYPAVTADSSGAFWCAWTGYDGRDCRIFLARLTRRGPVDTRAISAKGRNAYKPSIAVDADGGLWVAWHEFDGESYNVIARRMSMSRRNGTLRALPSGRLIAIAHTGEDEAHVSITPSPNRGGGIWFVYDIGEVPGGFGEWRRASIGQRSSMRNEVAHWKNGRVTALYPKYGGWPLTCDGEHGQVVFDAHDNLWLLERTYRRDGFGWDVIARHYDGAGWSDPAIISASKQGFDYYPSVSPLKDGMLVVWQSDNRDRQNDNCVAYGRESCLLSQVLPNHSNLGSEPRGVAQVERRRGPVTVKPPSKRFSIDYKGKKLYVFWGDMHVHSRLSRCAGNGDLDPFDAFFYPHDILGLDFMALTDHGMNLAAADRYNTRKLAGLQNNAPYFVSFLAQETSSCKQTGKNGVGWGHRNVIYLNDNYRFWWDFYDTTKDTPAGLWDVLEKTHADAFTIPHQLADHVSGAETDWSFFSDKWQPVAEVFQIRGSYEYKGCPWQAHRASSGACYYQDALDMGHHLGAIASSDHGGGHGFVAVFAERLGREPIFRAIQARRCYGTTEARMLLDFRVNGHLMGEMVKDNGDPRTLSIHIEALEPLKEIVVFKNRKVIFKKTNGLTSSVSAKFKDAKPGSKEDWYYLRAIQKDGRIAWSSPVWVKK